MAKTTPTINNAPGGVPSGKMTELRQRLLFVLGAIIVFRIGSFIPVPGVNPQALAQFFQEQQGTIIDMLGMFSGGALERLSILALGVMPYISASIIVQLLTAVVPSLEELKKEGEAGKRKINQYTRYGTVVLATFQSIGAAIALQGQGIAISPGTSFVFTAAVSLVTGTMFLMWLGEQVTERGIGNGISLIIFAGIVAGMPSAIGRTLEMVSSGEMNGFIALLIFAMAIAVVAFVVFVERGQRRITVHYARRQQARGGYMTQTSHLPFKMNMAGVIPPIFASSIILFPATLGRWASDAEGFGWMQAIVERLAPGEPLYTFMYGAMIVFFCFFYTALMYNSRETADNLKRSGAFIPGIRPGEQTGKYIDAVLTRLTIWGAAYVAAVCLLPEFLVSYWNVPFYFGGTSLLIILVVVMEFLAQQQSHLMSTQYESVMKKANLKGQGRSTR